MGNAALPQDGHHVRFCHIITERAVTEKDMRIILKAIPLGRAAGIEACAREGVVGQAAREYD